MSNPETSDVSTPATTTSGRVKWFNNKAGYGFITVSSGDNEGTDVFVHHSAIEVSEEQYRYLVQGEYVEFNLCSVDNDTHKWQAGSVKGINTGKLMCETRLETRVTRTQHRDDSVSNSAPKSRPPRGGSRDENQPHYRVRSRGSGPREGDEWMLVRRRAPKTTSFNAHQQSSQQSSSPQQVLRGRQSRS